MDRKNWFVEEDNQELRFGYAFENKIYSEKSEYQKIDVYKTRAYGRMLVLDDFVMTTESDEFIYHEMISHIPVCYHKKPESVLVIGGGDGGTVRELVKHDCIDNIVLCEIDGLVVDVCRQYFPNIAKDLNHPKVKLCIEDGIKYVENSKNQYDIIIIDSTDPVGPGEGLFTKDFYCNVKKALKPGGLVAFQSESPWCRKELLQRIYKNISDSFKVIKPYVAPIPSYPRGLWSWTLASNNSNDIVFNGERFSKIGKDLCYLTAMQAKHVFEIVPPFYRKKLALTSTDKY